MIRTLQLCGIRGSFAAIAAALAMISAAALAQSPALAQDELTMLQDTAEAPYALAAGVHVTDPDAFRLQVVLEHTDANSTYVISCTPRETYIERVVDGTPTRIGQARPYGQMEADSELELTIRRDRWRIVFILGREVLAQAWDWDLSGGGVGYTVAGGEVVDPLVQPLGRVYMTDDFMRTQSASSTWEAVSGTWKTQSLRVDEQSERMEADKSANAFSYWGKGGEKHAVTCTGYWFWHNYQITAAVRASETDPLGLVAYYQNPDNYVLARWTSALSEAQDADRLQIIGVQDGERSVLAEARGGHLPGQWYQFQLRVCDGVVQCLVDDEPRVVARASLFGQGQPGLYCEGTAGTFFDSVEVEDWEVLNETFDEPAPGKVVAHSGEWAHSSGAMHASGSGPRFAFTGMQSWERYWLAADVEARGAVGLAVCADDEAWYALRFGTSGSGVGYEGKAQIVRVAGTETTVLTSAPAHLAYGSSHRVKAVVDDGLITGYLDGKRVLDAYDSGAVSGRIGLFADGTAQASFDNLYLAMIPPKRIARVTKEFTEGDEHPEMAEWASTRAPWLKPEDENGGTWWTKGQYFGDKTIEFEIPNVKSAAGSMRLTLEAAPDEPSSGVTLALATESGSSTITATLVAGDEQLGEQTVEVSSDPCPVRFERKGTWVVATIDGNVVFNVKH